MKKKTRIEFGRRFELTELPAGPAWVNSDNGVVHVIPPLPNTSATSWKLHAASTSRRGQVQKEFTQPGAEERAFVKAVSLINGLDRAHLDD